MATVILEPSAGGVTDTGWDVDAGTRVAAVTEAVFNPSVPSTSSGYISAGAMPVTYTQLFQASNAIPAGATVTQIQFNLYGSFPIGGMQYGPDPVTQTSYTTNAIEVYIAGAWQAVQTFSNAANGWVTATVTGSWTTGLTDVRFRLKRIVGQDGYAFGTAVCYRLYAVATYTAAFTGVHYASSLATGGGSGTSASPYTLAELLAFGPTFRSNAGRLLNDGVYSVSAALTLSGSDYVDLGGELEASPPTIRLSNDLASATTYLLANGSRQGCSFSNFTLDLNGKVGGGLVLQNNGQYVYGVSAINLIGTATGIAAGGSYIVRKCYARHNGTGTGISAQSSINCCARGGGTGISVAGYGYSTFGCVAIGATNGFSFIYGGSGGPDWCLAINCTNGFQQDIYTTRFSRNFVINCTNATSGSYGAGTVRVLPASMFVDPNNGDLRLTASGRADSEVRRLMAILYGTPGITTDSLDILTSGPIDLGRGQLTRVKR